MFSPTAKEEPLVEGILLLPPQGMLSQLKKSWHRKYCQLFKASNNGIQRIEIYDSPEDSFAQNGARIITLEACIKICPSNQPNVLTLMTKTGTYHFGSTNETDLANWKSAIQSVAFKDDSSEQMVEEDNDLYCTSGDGIFTVKMAETEAAKNCRLEIGRTYTLVIGATDMKLINYGKVLYTWPYQFIRKYGYRNDLFTFEAGRKCDSGEGSFCVEHKNNVEIFKCFIAKKKLMKQMLSSDHSPSVECNDVQFQAALSMEAGSRSPLPPSNNLSELDMPSIHSQFSTSSQTPLMSSQFSPISQPPIIQSQFSPNSQPPSIQSQFSANSQTSSISSQFSPNSQKSLNSSKFSPNLQHRSFSPSPPKRPIKPPLPAKPKRLKPPKPVIVNKPDEKLFGSESIDGKYRNLSQTPDVPKKHIVISSDPDSHEYDDVEVRNNAWQRFGVNYVQHTEGPKVPNQRLNPQEDAEEEIDSRYEKMVFPVSQTNSVKSNSSSIIHNIPNPNDPPDYDRLQHFGSIHKKKNNPGYRNQSSSGDSNLDNYDVVEKMGTVQLDETPRYCDPSSIRKQSNTSTLSSNVSESQHKVDTEYALVSKPKRV